MSLRVKGVRLFSQRIPITRVENYIDISESHGPNAVAYGTYDNDGPSITISNVQSCERMRHTMVHECLHAMTDLTGLNTSLGEAEEKTVSRLAPAVLSWMRENPRLVAWLLETE